MYSGNFEIGRVLHCKPEIGKLRLDGHIHAAARPTCGFQFRVCNAGLVRFRNFHCTSLERPLPAKAVLQGEELSAQRAEGAAELGEFFLRAVDLEPSKFCKC